MTKNNRLQALLVLKEEQVKRKYDKEHYKYIREFLDNNKLNDIIDFIDTDIWEFIKCKFLAIETDKPFEECINTVDNIKKFFEETKNQTLRNFMLILVIASNEDKLDYLIDYFSDKDKIFITKIDIFNYASLSLLKKNMKSKNIDLVSFIKDFKEHKGLISQATNLYIAHEEIKFFIEHSIIVTNREIKKLEIENRKRYLLINALKEEFDINYITERVESLKEFREEVDREEKLSRREISSLKTSINNLEQAQNNKQILYYKDIIKGIKDPRIKEIILKIIYEHNNKYSKELEEELNKLNSNSDLKYHKLLNDIGISKDKYDLNSIRHLSIEELQILISVIKVLDISIEDKLNIINNTNIELVNRIKEYRDRSILNKEFISNNIDIFYSNKIDIFTSNLELLNKYNIDYKIFIDKIDILFNDTNILEDNIKILDEYKLLNNINNSNNYNYLISNNLRYRIDKLLELGYEYLLDDNIDILNYNTIDRLEVLKLIDYEINSIDELYLLLDEERPFFIKDDKIKEYIPNVLDFMDDDITTTIEELEEYRISDRLYNINGVLVSRNKVKHNLDKGLSIKESITMNMNLDKDKYKKLIISKE